MCAGLHRRCEVSLVDAGHDPRRVRAYVFAFPGIGSQSRQGCQTQASGIPVATGSD